jgi:hypothetical protein
MSRTVAAKVVLVWLILTLIVARPLIRHLLRGSAAY